MKNNFNVHEKITNIMFSKIYVILYRKNFKAKKKEKGLLNLQECFVLNRFITKYIFFFNSGSVLFSINMINIINENNLVQNFNLRYQYFRYNNLNLIPMTLHCYWCSLHRFIPVNFVLLLFPTFRAPVPSPKK